MLSSWDVVTNDHLDPGLLTQSSEVIQAWFPDAPDVLVSPADLVWKLGDANPAGRGFMTVAVADGEVVGTMTIVRKRFVLLGAPVEVGEVGDVFTDSRYLRGGEARVPWPDDGPQRYLSRSVFGRLSTETLQRGDAAGIGLYFGVANEAAMPGWIKRLGFRRWEGAPLLTYARPGPVLLAERTRLPRLAAVPVERLHAAVMATGLTRGRGLRVSELAPAASLDPIDELWDRVRPQWDFQPVRDATWFRFRFREHPTASYRIWLVHHRATLVGAYVTRSFVDGRRHQVTHLADHLFDRTRPELLPAAFASAAWREGRASTHSTGGWLQEPWSSRARRLGGVVETYRPGLILRDNPVAPLALDDIDVMPFATATSDNI